MAVSPEPGPEPADTVAAGPPRYTCVGSGTGVPSAERGPACHLLEAGDLKLLMDLGSGSLRSLAGLGRGIAELAAVGVTHRHQDHVADLLPLLFAMRNFPEQRPAEPLTLFGYPGLRRDLQRQAEVFGAWVLEPGVELDLRELPPGASLTLERGGGWRARVESHAVAHSAEAVAFRVELRSAGGAGTPARPRARGWTLAYSGDSGAAESLVELARGADLFVCECAFPDGEGVEGHLTPSEMLPICAEAAPRRTLATHLYPAWERRGVEREWRRVLARAGSGLRVEPASDGMSVDLGPPAEPGPKGATGGRERVAQGPPGETDAC